MEFLGQGQGRHTSNFVSAAKEPSEAVRLPFPQAPPTADIRKAFLVCFVLQPDRDS